MLANGVLGEKKGWLLLSSAGSFLSHNSSRMKVSHNSQYKHLVLSVTESPVSVSTVELLIFLVYKITFKWGWRQRYTYQS